MKNKVIFFLAFFLLVLTISFTSAQLSLDIRLDKQSHSIGEELKFTVLLLEDRNPISQQVDVIFSDVMDKKQVKKTVTTNTENTLVIGEDFPSRFWEAKAQYQDKSVKRDFSVKEYQNVKFSITKDSLIITNNGNVPYTKEIQIMIGNNVIPQKLNLGVGRTKEIKLVAPDGNYNIKVTDGENTLTESGVHLTGTGQVVGALDQNLIDNSILGGAQDPNETDKFFSSKRSPIAFVFVGAIFILGILLLIEKRIKKKAESQ